MASNVVRATLIADAKRYRAGFKEAEGATESFEKKTETSGRKVVKAVQGFLALQAVQAVKAFADDAARAYSDFEQSTGAAEAVFGTAADRITGRARKAATEFGLSMGEFQDASSLLGAQLKNQLGLDVDAAADKTTELIGKASDLAAQFGGTTFDAISAIGSLLRGERDPIEKYAVSMNDAAITAKALEMGLADTAGELTQQNKAAASLELLYQQTGDAAGAFGREQDTLAGKTQRANAQIENNKALVGRAIQSAYKDVGIPAVSAFHTALGNVALAFMDLTGEMEKGEVVLARIAEKYGEAATPIDQLRVLIEDFAEQTDPAATGLDHMAEMANSVVTETGEGLPVLEAWLGLVPQIARETELTTEEQDLWTAAIERAIDVERQKQVDLGRGRGREEEYAAALRGTEEQAERTTTSLQEYAAELRAQQDPVFNAIRKAREYQEAQAAVNAAIEEHGEGSPEHVEALLSEQEAAADAAGAYGDLAESGLAKSRQEAVKLFESFGADKREAELLADQLMNLDAIKLGDKTIDVHVSVPTWQWVDDARGVKPRGTGRVALARGGVATGPTSALIGEAADDEAVIPLNSQGVGKIADAMKRAGMANGHPVVIQLNINASRSQPLDGWAIVEALQNVERRNGPLPIRVRT